MSTTTQTHTNTTSLAVRVRAIGGRCIRRAAAIWSELDHAQRRMFEIRTGIPASPKAREIDDLERLYHWRPRAF